MAVFSLPEAYQERARYWAPPLITGAVAWAAFLLVGNTPVIRASGLALAIVGVGMMLRPLGAPYAITGALAFAFCPAFWVQTGGLEQLDPGQVLIAIAFAAAGVAVVLRVNRRIGIGVLTGIAIFGVFFLIIIGTPRSLRLTTLISAWLLFLLTDALFAANPRPDTPPTGQLGIQHTWGMLLLLIIGIINDPLVALLTPAVLLGLFLTGKRMPVIFWLLLVAAGAWGFWGIGVVYADSAFWTFNAAVADAQNLRVPYLIGMAWREPGRWLDLITGVVAQFTIVGLVLGLIGLARLARWYPPVGVVTMIAFGTYATFGLMYFGRDATVLLLPMLMILVLWMTYAVYALSHWLQKSTRSPAGYVRWLAPAAFLILPVLLLFRITGFL